MNSIKLLDCTLRDGGYINNWDFGNKAIVDICSNITKAKVDIIEIGFLKNEEYDLDKSIYNSNSQIEKIINKNIGNTKFFGMMDLKNPIPIEKVDERSNTSIDGIRVIFKKNKIDEAYTYCEKLIELGYEVFAQIVSAHLYSDSELKDVCLKYNNIDIKALSIADTLGVIKKDELINKVKVIDKYLRKDIKIGYHSHNNLDQAYENACAFLELDLDRDCIIDASAMGMGRGAGNLCLEKIIPYLNEHHGKQYDINPVLYVIDNYIEDIHKELPWGYSTRYQLSAKYRCHPNYAKYFYENGITDNNELDNLFKQIPLENISDFSVDIANQLLKK